MKNAMSLFFCAVLFGSAVASESADVDEVVDRIFNLDVDSDYGEYLAGECMTCHGKQQSEGVPVIEGVDKRHLITELIRFQNGSRSNPTMTSIAKALGEEEIASLAEFYSQLVGQ